MNSVPINGIMIYESSATGLFRTVLIILIIYFLFRILARYLFPALARFWLKRFEKSFYERNPHLQKDKESKEGEVKIEYAPDEKKAKIPDDAGEYVDYQEIKE